MQSLVASLPSAAFDVPVGHSLHLGWPACSWYVPARHSAQPASVAVPTAATYMPLGHSMQPLLSATRADSTALPYLPAPQLSHCPCPLLDWCFPAGHALQSVVLVDPSPDA
jgi:hypothetical protein